MTRLKRAASLQENQIKNKIMGRSTHKKTHHPLFRRWASILDRCSNPNSKDYPYYGGRGITVCDEWKNDFMKFYHHVLTLPNAMKEGYTIDRIRNNENYKPGNVRWATRRDQMLNRRKQKNNTTGFIGVSPTKEKRYKSVIKVSGEIIYIGVFDTPKEAAIARDKYIIENDLSEYKLQVS